MTAEKKETKAKKTKPAKKEAAPAVVLSARMYEVIRRPVITEKSTAASEQDKVVFQVKDCASKDEVKQAVEAIFKVKVVKVNTLNTKAKVRNFRGRAGSVAGYKKAIVTLQKGQKIDIAAGVA